MESSGTWLRLQSYNSSREQIHALIGASKLISIADLHPILTKLSYESTRLARRIFESTSMPKEFVPLLLSTSFPILVSQMHRGQRQLHLSLLLQDPQIHGPGPLIVYHSSRFLLEPSWSQCLPLLSLTILHNHHPSLVPPRRSLILQNLLTSSLMATSTWLKILLQTMLAKLSNWMTNAGICNLISKAGRVNRTGLAETRMFSSFADSLRAMHPPLSMLHMLHK